MSLSVLASCLKLSYLARSAMIMMFVRSALKCQICSELQKPRVPRCRIMFCFD